MSRIIGRVVVGVSGSPENLHALRHAVELARHYDATLIAVNARDARGDHVWQHAASLVLRTAFDEGLGGLPKDLECVLLAAPGAPGPALLSVADRANDILVLGAARRGRGHGRRRGSGPRRGRPGWLRRQGPRLRHRWPRRRTAPPAVAGYCITRAVCSVLTVPPPPLAVSARASSQLPLSL